MGHSGATAVIPPRRHRQAPRDDDRAIDPVRYGVERRFQQRKPCRRLATRDEGWKQKNGSMGDLARAMIWLV